MLPSPDVYADRATLHIRNVRTASASEFRQPDREDPDLDDPSPTENAAPLLSEPLGRDLKRDRPMQSPRPGECPRLVRNCRLREDARA